MRNDIGEAGFEALARSEGAASLNQLDVSEIQMSARARETITTSEHLHTVRVFMAA